MKPTVPTCKSYLVQRVHVSCTQLIPFAYAEQLIDSEEPLMTATTENRRAARVGQGISCVAGNVNNVGQDELLTLEPVAHPLDMMGREDAPRQGPEGAPDAWLEIEPRSRRALLGMEVGHELMLITWLHDAKRDVLKGHHAVMRASLPSVFYTRSPARPNPLGLHPVTVRAIDGTVKIGRSKPLTIAVVDISASTRADG